jgi:hypothetical protein
MLSLRVVFRGESGSERIAARAFSTRWGQRGLVQCVLVPNSVVLHFTCRFARFGQTALAKTESTNDFRAET